MKRTINAIIVCLFIISLAGPAFAERLYKSAPTGAYYVIEGKIASTDMASHKITVTDNSGPTVRAFMNPDQMSALRLGDPVRFIFLKGSRQAKNLALWQ